jgi:hypothetical protein
MIPLLASAVAETSIDGKDAQDGPD